MNEIKKELLKFFEKELDLSKKVDISEFSDRYLRRGVITKWSKKI